MRRTLTITLSIALAWGAATSTAHAIEPYSFSVAALGGLGGTLDADGDIGHPGLQLNLSMVTKPDTLLGLRVGELQLDDGEGVAGLADSALRYATLAGEYRFDRTFYESGIFLGVGAYDLSGDVLVAGADEGTSIGGTLGVSGDFEITRRWSVLVELAGHWADFDRLQLFAGGHAGVAFRF